MEDLSIAIKQLIKETENLYKNKDYLRAIAAAFRAKELIQIAGNGNSSPFSKSICKCFVLLTLTSYELSDHGRTMVYFCNSFDGDENYTCKLYKKLAGCEFGQKIYEFLVNKCFYNEQLLDALFYVNTLINHKSFSGYITQHAHSLQAAVNVWLDCLISKKNGDSEHDESFSENIKKLSVSTVKNALMKWLKLGKEEFYNFSWVEANVSLSIAVNLLSYVDAEHSLCSEIFLHVFAIKQKFPTERELRWQYEMMFKSYLHGETAKEYVKKWEEKGDEFKDSFDKAMSFYTASIRLTRALVSIQQMEGSVERYLHTTVAMLHLKHKVYHEIPVILRIAYGCHDSLEKTICEKWKKIATDIHHISNTIKDPKMVERLKEDTISIYQLSFYVSPVKEVELRRNIASNICMLSRQIKRFEEAVHYGKECVKLDGSWYKGYYRLGIAYYEMGKCNNCVKHMIKGMSLVKDESKWMFLEYLVKSRVKSGSNDSINTIIPTCAFKRILTDALKADSKVSWMEVQCMFLCFNIPKDLDTTTISFEKVMKNATNEQFVLQIVERNGLGGAPCFPLINQALDKNWLETAAIVIIKRPRFQITTVSDTALSVAARFCIKTEKTELMRTMCQMVCSENPTDISSQFMSAILFCFEGLCTPVKLATLKILNDFRKTLSKGLPNAKVMEKVKNRGSTSDKRFILLFPTIKGSVKAEVKTTETVIPQPKKVELVKKKDMGTEPVEVHTNKWKSTNLEVAKEDLSNNLKKESRSSTSTSTLKSLSSDLDKLPGQTTDETDNKNHGSQQKESALVQREQNNLKKARKKKKKKKTQVVAVVSPIEVLPTTKEDDSSIKLTNEERMTKLSDSLFDKVSEIALDTENMSDEENEKEIQDGLEVTNTNANIKASTHDPQADKCTDNHVIDVKTNEEDVPVEHQLNFEGLPWEVDCTQEVWKILKNEKLDMTIKKKIVEKLLLLAQGEHRGDLAKRLVGVNNEIVLFEAKVDGGRRIIWEKAIAFSARCSMDPTSFNLGSIDNIEKGAVYVDKIRVWNIALHHDDVPQMIRKIENSHRRGQKCLILKHLNIKVTKSDVIGNNKETIPNVYVNEDFVKDFMKEYSKKKTNEKTNKDKDYLFFPPASPDEQEYTILKFYSFTSAMASRILSLSHSKVDFPFQVSELEHAFIHLEPSNTCSLMVIGRSGTGKTTCCLYRLWARYQNYWKAATTAGPHILKLKSPSNVEVTLTVGDSKQEVSEVLQKRERLTSARISQSSEVSERGMVCLCVGPCNCEAYLSDISESSFVLENEVIGTVDEVICDLNDKSDVNEGDDFEHLRQLMITKNEVLAEEIKKNFCQLQQGIQDKYSPVDLRNIKSIEEIESSSYPLFITTKELLLLLDASLDGTPFFERHPKTGKMTECVPGWSENKPHSSIRQFLADEDDNESDDDGGEFDEGKDAIHESEQEEANVDARSQKKSRMRSEVTYEMFANEMWKKINKANNLDIHPSLVWMEIKSFIKGSAEAFLSENGYLSKKDYLNFGHKRAHNFSQNREIVYDLFERYRKEKRKVGYFDEMDIHFNIYKRLKSLIVPPWGFHEIYVDETQDFTQAELLILLKCSLNPNALFFCGDTAQSIINGVAFRFCDLRSLFRIAEKEFEKCNLPSPVKVPEKPYQLIHNFRSHCGILQLASVILKYLKLLFPESFDHKLQPDIGLFPGPKPVILDTDDFSELAMLLQGAKRESSAIEFGAHQVVLVQNETSKESLPAELSYGLVLTIYEAKGLEFDDVLLYNFFKDSQAKEEWRVITTYVNELEDIGQKCQSNLLAIDVIEELLECESRPLEFNDSKHKILNAELKKLYTAVTRAKVNVWIFDQDKEKRSPIFEMLVKKSLVDVKRADGKPGDTSGFATKSSKEEWERQGLFFYEKSLWKTALKCAIRAEDYNLKKKCEAQISKEEAFEADKEWKNNKSIKRLQNSRDLKLREAADLLLDCQLIKEAEECLGRCNEWRSLALLYERQENYVYAGRCYKKLGNADGDALRCFDHAGNYRSSAALLKERRRYIEYLNILQSTCNANYVRNAALDVCKQYYKEGNLILLKKALTFVEYKDRVSFLKEKEDCESVLLEIYRDNNVKDMVDHLVRKGRYLEAAAATDSALVKTKCLLNAIRQEFTNETEIDLVPIATELEIVVNRLGNSNEQLQADVLYLASFILKKTDRVKDMWSLCEKLGSIVGELLCFDLWYKLDRNCNNKYISGKSVQDIVGDIVLRVFNHIIDLLNPAVYTASMNRSFQSMGFKRITTSNYFYVEEPLLILFLSKIFSCSSINIMEKRQSSDSVRRFTVKILYIVIKEIVSMYHKALLKDIKVTLDNLLNPSQHKSIVKTFNKGKHLLHSIVKLQKILQAKKVDFSPSPFLQSLGSFDWLDIITNNEVVDFLATFVRCHMHLLHLIDYSNIINLFPTKNEQTYHVLKCIGATWNDNVEKELVDLNLYLKLSLLSYLADKDYPLIESHILHDTGESSKVKRKFPLNVLLPHIDGLESFYLKYHFIGMLKSFHLLLLKPITVEKLPTPHFSTFCDVIEIPISLVLYSLAVIDDEVVGIPNGLHNKLTMYDRLYSTEDNSGFNTAMSNLKLDFRERIVDNFKKFLTFMFNDESNFCGLVCLIRYLDKLSDADSSSEDWWNSMRFIEIVLLILMHADRFKLKFGVINLIKSHKSTGTSALSSIYNLIGSLNSSSEAKNLTLQLLRLKKDQLLSYRWNRRKNRFQLENIISNSAETASMPVVTSERKVLLKRHPEVEENSILDEQPTQIMLEEKQEIDNTYQLAWTEMTFEPIANTIDTDVAGGNEDDIIDTTIVSSKKEETKKRDAAASTIQFWWRYNYHRINERNIEKSMTARLDLLKNDAHIKLGDEDKLDAEVGLAGPEFSKHEEASVNHEEHFNGNKCTLCHFTCIPRTEHIKSEDHYIAILLKQIESLEFRKSLLGSKAYLTREELQQFNRDIGGLHLKFNRYKLQKEDKEHFIELKNSCDALQSKLDQVLHLYGDKIEKELLRSTTLSLPVVANMYFDTQGFCRLCNVLCQTKVEHIKSEKHLQNMEVFTSIRDLEESVFANILNNIEQLYRMEIPVDRLNDISNKCDTLGIKLKGANLRSFTELKVECEALRRETEQAITKHKLVNPDNEYRNFIPNSGKKKSGRSHSKTSKKRGKK